MLNIVGYIEDKVVGCIDYMIYQLKMLKHRPKLFWNSLFIREDEFHTSLDMDAFVMLDMNKEDKSKYIRDLCKRRDIAHNRDLEK